MREIVKRLKCDKCNRNVQASNKMKDERFYCMNCGMNLGIHAVKESLSVKGDKK